MSLYVFETGPDSAPTVVLLSGGGVSGWSWQYQVDNLKNDYHLLVPDLPGHGKSQEAGSLTIPGTAKQVAELIRQRAHGGQAHVVGLSLGAQVTLQMLADFPDLMHSAVMSGTFVNLSGKRTPYQQPIVRKLLEWTIVAYMPMRMWPFLLRANARQYRIPEQFYPQFAEDTRLLTPDLFMHILDANQVFTLPPGLEQVHVPALVLAGEKEPGSVHKALPVIAHALPMGQGYVVQGLWHNGPIEDPALFNEILRDWFAGLPLPTRLKPVS